MNMRLGFAALRPERRTEPRTALISQLLQLRWQVLEHALSGERSLARQEFKALKGVAVRLRGRADCTPDDNSLVDMCVREAELAVLTCRIRL